MLCKHVALLVNTNISLFEHRHVVFLQEQNGDVLGPHFRSYKCNLVFLQFRFNKLLALEWADQSRNGLLLC